MFIKNIVGMVPGTALAHVLSRYLGSVWKLSVSIFFSQWVIYWVMQPLKGKYFNSMKVACSMPAGLHTENNFAVFSLLMQTRTHCVQCFLLKLEGEKTNLQRSATQELLRVPTQIILKYEN